jgi:hypothetical protein
MATANQQAFAAAVERAAVALFARERDRVHDALISEARRTMLVGLERMFPTRQ